MPGLKTAGSGRDGNELNDVARKGELFGLLVLRVLMVLSFLWPG